MANKTLNIYAPHLQKETTIMLMFEPPISDRLFKDQFPVVWKIATFRAGGHAKATIQYHERLAFGYAQIDQDNLVEPDAWVEVKNDDHGRISRGAGAKRFGDASERNDPKLLTCKNSSSDPANMSIGFVKGDGVYQQFQPVFVWTGVGAGSDVTTEFIPKLTAYVTRDYKGAPIKFILNMSHLKVPSVVTEMVHSKVETDAIWTCNLHELDDVTSWNLIEDNTSGDISIRQESHMF
ncbi:hypothetical protein RSOLAG22IIIB_07697 [Rhizoctonia solani]|uniref:Uncharacterized protein n=1 Tax=Rhizoctonia solani TaxID=456999 RepID=A0A0K6FPA9_9AGAM|nr:hypothetical protein RSOLAG22IIIB_07697 [Rhizoctonia solani]